MEGLIRFVSSGILLFNILTLSALAHIPVIVRNQSSKNKPVRVTKPEISYAFYGELSGEPHFYKIDRAKPFHIYVNILVPDYAPREEATISHDMSFEIRRDGITLIARDGAAHEWKRFYEKYGRDHYYMGPSFESDFGAGTYLIKVYSKTNRGRYALAIGKKEKFTPLSLVQALIKARSLDTWFFRPPIKKE